HMPPFPAGRLLPLALACCILLAAVAAGWVYVERDSQPIHFDRLKPAVGDLAPDFTLRDADGVAFRLATHCEHKPVVIEFGSATCVECVLGHFERKEELAREFSDRAEFVFVYCREANPGRAVGAMATKSEPAPGQTFTWDERAERARSFRRAMGVSRRVL